MVGRVVIEVGLLGDNEEGTSRPRPGARPERGDGTPLVAAPACRLPAGRQGRQTAAL